jgi:DNA (cytosine-5)-methyltransferase 1
VIRVADLFAGAGGMSTGCLLAAEARGERVELVAVNHWPVSVETHTRNHPEAR